MALTPKQERFVREYLVDLNATAAAIRAGYSERTAKQIGYQLLKHPEVIASVQAAQAERAKRVGLTADEVLRGIASIANDTNEKTECRLKAYELAGKHLKLFTDKVEISGGVTLEELVPRKPVA